MSWNEGTAGQRWEYCALVSHASEDRRAPQTWACRISYFTLEGVKTSQVKSVGETYPADAFERALAQLGDAGWELVSLHHELVRNNMNVTGEEFLATVHTGYSFSPFGVAYLKRPVQAGRAIDQPPVVWEDAS
jgi:hypothetical protein